MIAFCIIVGDASPYVYSALFPSLREMSLEYLLYLYDVATAASWLIPLHGFPIGLDNPWTIDDALNPYVYRRLI